MKLSALAVATALFSGAVFAAPLTLQTYNPQEKGLFAVNSTLVSGPHEAVLFDAQFSVKDGEKLVEMIRKNGKPLSRIVITSGDPDFYFGLEPLVKAFPQALEANSFTIDGEKVTIMQPHDYAAFVWIRANKTILGGTGVAWGMHLWTADTQTPASRQQWRNTLDQMIALHPQRVIPGHYLGTPPEGDSAVRFTKTYLQQFEQALKTHSDSAGVIKAMEAQWPGLAETSSLELSAKVNTGEMKW
ncbi:metallo-beta-lactamase superfamily protein [Klebsiella pneumoniae]|nr:MBL fold metallo-hydrolase [Klebsiella pneumoniae]STT71716.1 metallo-beta-lactamase superfamily protein [Klebsiella pneumoniae]